MKRWLFAAVALLSHHAYSGNATACGSTPLLVTPLLPLADAEAVPTDVALMASNNSAGVGFQLREIAPAPSTPTASDADAGLATAGLTDVDAGAPNDAVVLMTECVQGQGSGALCIARPAERLKPLTAYEWSIGLIPNAAPESEWRRFTTGAGPSDAALRAPDVRVKSHDIYVNAMCVGEVASLEFSSAALVAPLVVYIPGLTPTYVSEPLTLTPESPTVEMFLYGDLDCVQAEAIDEVGTRTPLRELCIETELPPTTKDALGNPIANPNAPNSGEPANGPAEGSEGDPAQGVVSAPVEETSDSEGCAVRGAQGGAPTSLLALTALGLACVGRRRRHQ